VAPSGGKEQPTTPKISNTAGTATDVAKPVTFDEAKDLAPSSHRAATGTALAIAADVSSRDEYQRIVSRMLEECGSWVRRIHRRDEPGAGRCRRAVPSPPRRHAIHPGQVRPQSPAPERSADSYPAP
jgi:hypothetical protein